MNVPLPSNLAVVDGSPEWFSRADNAWKLIAATLVGNPSWSAKCSRAHNLVRMSFGDELLPFWGKPAMSLEHAYLFKKAFLGAFPNATMCVFAAITLILIAGAVLGHMNFYAWMLPWPFSTPTLAHLVILDVLFFRKPSVIGAVQGMITGLVCITPAAGVVQGWASLIMGLLSGSIPWFTMMVIHKRSKLLQKVDDTMAVFHTHAIAETLGGLLTGLFADPRLNRLFYGHDAQYVVFFYGFGSNKLSTGFRQMGVQILGIIFVIFVNFIRIFFPLRISEEDMEIGDEAAHGEEAYAIWGQGDKLENSSSKYGSSLYNDVEAGAPKKKRAGTVQMMSN
ncbi:Ammonium transporter 3 member 1 [Glycine soja]|uniref:Ammonium transporter 3 member 1 n=1 Tax=Glycine soja TaxID=3848 RepID=A0A0B2NUU4_GLYSO|nr:Ammonium transporter 3 member 1 [Glycine soja]RZB41797.1 Ammonium transporter 3 member 1 [Glycine soja]